MLARKVLRAFIGLCSGVETTFERVVARSGGEAPRSMGATEEGKQNGGVRKAP